MTNNFYATRITLSRTCDHLELNEEISLLVLCTWIPSNLPAPSQIHEDCIFHWRQVRKIFQNFDIIAFRVDHDALLGDRMAEFLKGRRRNIQRKLECWLVKIPPRSMVQSD